MSKTKAKSKVVQGNDASPPRRARTRGKGASGTEPSTGHRQTQVERSDRMRKRLLAAAIKVIRKRGYLGFTTVETAQVAGVTRGAPLHHFGNTETFLLAALEQLFISIMDQSTEEAAHLAADEDILAAIAADARRSYFQDGYYTGLEVMLSASKHKKPKEVIQSIGDRFRLPVENLWRDRLAARGVPVDLAENVVWLINCVFRGAAIRALLTHDPTQIEATTDFALSLARMVCEGALRGTTASAPALDSKPG